MQCFGISRNISTGVDEMKTTLIRIIRILSAGVIIAMALLSCSLAASSSAANYVTGDIIEYGYYPQTKVTDAGLIASLNSQTLQTDNTVTFNGAKYQRVYFTQYTAYYTTTTPGPNYSWQDDNGYFINTIYWFKFEPIRWKVLSSANGELFVLSEKILNSRAYNQTYTNITWETCTLRTWLNDDFCDTAFSSAELARIKTSLVTNPDNATYGTDGGNNTNDKLFLLSYGESITSSYGFNTNYGEYDAARRAQGTDYAKCAGLWVSTTSPYTGKSYWKLRSPGAVQNSACLVYDYGYVGHNSSVHSTDVGIRPAFRIKLTSEILTPDAGSGCIINNLNGFVYGLKPGISSLTGFAEAAQGYELSCTQTQNGFGTGTTVNIIHEGNTEESYIIVIFGDSSGDGNVDSIDAGKFVDYENYMLTWDSRSDAAYLKAGDLNGDGNIDSLDAGLAVDAENYLITVNQITGLAG